MSSPAPATRTPPAGRQNGAVRRLPPSQRLAALVVVGVALAILGSLAPWQWLTMGIGMVTIGIVVLIVQRRQRQA